MSSDSPSPRPDPTRPLPSGAPKAPGPGAGPNAPLPGAGPRGPGTPPGGNVPPTTPLPPTSARPAGDREAPRATRPAGPPPTEAYLAKTRAAAAWFFTAVALIVMVLLIILILQNQARVEVTYLGLEALLPLGVALLIAAVTGGALVAIVGVIRLTQLRRHAKRLRRIEGEQRPR